MSIAKVYRTEGVMPIRSDAEYKHVLETIRTLTAAVTHETRDGQLLVLQQRAQIGRAHV